MINLHNTLTRSVDNFEPQNSETVSLYTCGPTVYDKQTIGNYTAYVRWDILARMLRHRYGLDWYMNITDVGHLVSDADEGEDKLEKGARREGKSAWEIADFYTADFIKSLEDLNLSITKDHLIKATDHIDEQIELIKILEDKGYTYTISDGVYFDSTKFPDYGKMARLDIAGQQAGARVGVGEKKHPSDFALWKFSPQNQKRDMEWDSPWGKGFPGWHIECSAMAMKYLGETIDIHTGGIDHIPVHHTNEIAQSEAATGKQFVRFWLHSNFLQIDNTKIAKSLGNGYTLDDVYAKGFSAMDFRMFVLQSHYQTEANFTWEAIKAAKVRLADLQAIADLRFQSVATNLEPFDFESYKNKLVGSLEDNLNTPRALAILSEFIANMDSIGSRVDAAKLEQFLSVVDDLLGLKLLSSSDIDEEAKNLIARRSEARAAQNWSHADEIRDQLLSTGIYLNDTSNGTVWRRN